MGKCQNQSTIPDAVWLYVPTAVFYNGHARKGEEKNERTRIESRSVVVGATMHSPFSSDARAMPFRDCFGAHAVERRSHKPPHHSHQHQFIVHKKEQHDTLSIQNWNAQKGQTW